MDQQAASQRTEAIGTFYRIAHDLADELGKANVLPTTLISANFGTYPRQMLREASRLLAPLGTAVVFAATFNRTYRNEVLDPNLFATLEEVRLETADWLRRYNTQRPHDSLGRVPPLTFLPRPTTTVESTSGVSA